MQTVLIVVHLMIVLALVVVVLLQRSEGGALGIGGGGGFLSSRGQANALTRATSVLAAGFFATSLGLAIVAGIERAPRSIIQPNLPGGPAAPGGNLLDQLRGQGAQREAPPPPAAPSAPASAATPAAPQPPAPQ